MLDLIQEFDRDWFTAINGMAGRFPLLDEVMFQFSQEGNLIVPGLCLALYWAWRNWGKPELPFLACFCCLG